MTTHDQIQTLNLADGGEGYVPLNPPHAPPAEHTRSPIEMPPHVQHQPPAPDHHPMHNKASTAFQTDEKNVRVQQQMDSTPLSDVMMDQGPPQGGMMAPPVLEQRAPMQSLQMQAPVQNAVAMAPPQAAVTEGAIAPKNPGGLTDDQMTALLVAACTAAAISRPVQEKLSTSVPRFLNDMGQRSGVGLAATGIVAAVIFYFGKSYVIK